MLSHPYYIQLWSEHYLLSAAHVLRLPGYVSLFLPLNEKMHIMINLPRQRKDLGITIEDIF